MIDYSERFSCFHGNPQVRCYKCGKLIPYRNKQFIKKVYDENELLKKLYICKECSNKLKKVKKR
jgi:DNA-directed RNA polymerase subunit N (RpoN/RPB10)